MKTFILSAATLAAVATAGAQTLNVYKPAGHVAVERGAHTMSAPFSGGFNTPQFAMADLNGDGKLDLVSFEGYGKVGVRTFINHGIAGMPEYRYEPEYEQVFPEINNYLILKDYNCDGIPDLFHGGLGGFNISKGYYANGMLHFQFMKELSYPVFGGMANAYVGNSCIPGIEDVDGDGDLDFLSYSINGMRILYYKNLQKEYGLPCDSIRIKVESGCWGGTLQPAVRTTILGIPKESCDTNYISPPAPHPSGPVNPGTTLSGLAKVTMHGSNTLCLIDMDGDGDMDYLNGNGAFNDLQFLENGRSDYNYPVDSIVGQDTLWQSNGKVYEESNYPAAFYVDYNGDGKKDIIVAPHGAGSRNRNQIWYYQNNGTATVPRFDFTTDSLLSNDVIDAGRNARPLFYDFNKDGKPDLLVGGLEKLSGGTEVSRLHYYENITTTSGQPRFRYITDDLVGLAGLNIYAADPAVGDVDGDGKDDLLIGRADGKVMYFRNMAASANIAPVWTLQESAMTRNGTDLLNVWSSASPAFYDINKDGKSDIVIGQNDGTLTAYLNTNSANGVVSFGTAIDTFGGVRVPDWDTVFPNTPFPFRYSKPFFGRLQAGSNKDYLLMGGLYGRLYVWDDVNTGNVHQVFPLVADTFSNINLPSGTAPAVADVDGDGKLEMVVGNGLGGLFLYWTGAGLGLQSPVIATSKVQVFPNPTSTDFAIDLSGMGNHRGALLTITDLSGRVIFRENWGTDKKLGRIATQGWPVGIYVLSIVGEAGVETQKLQVVR